MRRSSLLLLGIALSLPLRPLLGQVLTWPAECRTLSARVGLQEDLPKRLADLRPWMERLSRTINAAEPAFLTPAIAPPVDALAEVRRLWREDPQAVEWALAKLTADGSWEGRWPGQMYGRYYEELSGRAGPILYFLHRSEAPRWDWALFAIKKPITAPEEQVLFWHGCLALWAAIATQTDSGGAAVEEAFPPWLSMAYGVIGRVYPLLTPAHQAALRASATPYLIAALGLHE